MLLKKVSNIKSKEELPGRVLSSLFARVSLAVFVLALSLFQTSAQAAICIGANCSYPDIQTAINAATSGQTVSVDAGTYSENITFGPTNITLQGAGAGSTTIEGSLANVDARVVTFSSASTTSATALDGFTINNRYIWGSTGGIIITGGASPTLSNLIITDNSLRNDATDHMGGGIHIANGGASISSTTISNNMGDTGGGGLYATTANGSHTITITNSTISGNWIEAGGSYNQGGGLFALDYAGTITITNSTIDSNTIPAAYNGKGGGIVCNNCALLNLIDTDVTNNSTNRTATSDLGGGIAVLSGGRVDVTRGTIHSNRAQKGAAGIYLSGAGSIFNGDRCSVKGNETYGAQMSGGGFRIDTGATVTLTNCMITGNSTIVSTVGAVGAGFYVNGGTLNLNHSTVAGNYGHRSGGGIYINSGSATIVSSLIWGNTSAVTPTESDLRGNANVTYSAIQHGTGYTSGTGTITLITGTVFVSPDLATAGVGKTGGNYRLKSDAVEAINTADPGSTVTTDFEGFSRPVAGINDMGASEEAGASGVIISGTIYRDKGINPTGSGTHVRLLVNGGSPLTTITVGGAYSFTVNPTAGHTLTAHVDDASYSGTTVTISDSNTLTNLDIYNKHLITRFDNGLGSLNNTNLVTADDGDPDILYSIASNNLTVEGTDTSLHIWSGDTYTPGGTIDTVNMDIDGTLNAEANAINASGHWRVDTTANFTSTGTVTFDASSGTANINPGGTDANHDFNNATFDDGGGTATFMLQGALMVTNNFRLNDGILDTDDTADYPITAGNNFDQPTGQIQANDSTLTTGGNFNVEGGEDSTGYNRASIILNGGGATVTYNSLNNPDVNGFFNLSVGQSGAVDNLTNDLAVKNVLSVGSGSFTGGLGIYLTGNDNVLSFDPAANLAINALRFMNTSPNIASLANGYSTDIYAQGDNTVVTQTGNITLNAGKTLYIHGGGQLSRTVTYDTAGFELHVGGNILLGEGSDTGLKTLNITNSTVSVGGDFNIQPVGGATAQAQVTTPGSTVTFNGSADQRLISSGNTFNNIGLNNSGAGGSDNLIITDTLDMNGALRIDDGDFDITASNPQVTLAGDLTITANGTIDTSSRTNKLIFDGTSILNDNSSAGPQDLEHVELNGTSLTLASNTLVRTITTTAGTLNLGNGGHILEVNGTGTPISNSGSFTAGTSTVKYTGTGTATNITTLAYDSLQLSPTVATSYAMLGDLDAMTGNLTIGVNATLDASGSPNDYNLSANDITIHGTYTPQGSTIQVSGDWSNNGTFTASTSTVELTGTNQNISGTTSFNNLYKTISSADTLTFEASLTQTINGTIRLKGIIGERLTLASSDAGTTRWNLNVMASATKDMDYLSVSWADGSSSALAQRPIEPSNSIDGGDNLEWFGTPVITVDKSSSVISDPINGLSNPKRIPSAVVQYDIKVTNSGTGAPDLDTVFITDPIDTSTVEFDFTSGVTLTDGAQASTLILGTVTYSNNSGVSYVYSPTGPYDPNITNVKILASGTFDYGAVPANNFTLSYKVRVK